MSGALVKAILNLLLANVTFNPFFLRYVLPTKNLIFWGIEY